MKHPSLVLMGFALSACASPQPFRSESTPQPKTATDAQGPQSSPDGVAAEAETPSPFADLLMSADECQTPPRPVRREEALEDVAALERIVRRGWAGVETVAEREIDLDAVFEALRREIREAVEPIAPEELRAALVKHLSPLRDRHMALWEYSERGWARYESIGTHEDAYVADFEVEEKAGVFTIGSGRHKGEQLVVCRGRPLTELVRPTVDAEGRLGRRLIALSSAPLNFLDCVVQKKDGKQVGIAVPMRALDLSEKSAESADTFAHSPGKFPVIRLRSLDNGSADHLEQFVASARAARDSEAILVDLRGNAGGSDTWVQDWFAELVDGSLEYPTIHELQSEVTLQGDVNGAVCRRARGAADPGGRALIERELSEASRALDGGRNKVGQPFLDWSSRTPTVQGRAPGPFEGRLVVLVDKGCASSCETFLQYARQIPRTVVVGENSAGVGEFGDVRPYRLPQSGLGFSAPKKRFHSTRPELRIPEGRGALPDLWIDTAQPEDAAKRLTRCLADKKCAARFSSVLY